MNKIIVFGFIIRMLFAIIQGFWPEILGDLLQNKDALQFHEAAIDVLNEREFREFAIGHIYSSWLALLYFVTIPDQLIGSFFSCSAWATSAYLLCASMKKMGMSKKNIEVSALIYALWPASIVFCSTTLREAYQILFVNFALYGLILVVKQRQKLVGCGCVYFATVGMSILHGALIATGAYLCLVGTLYALTLHRVRYWILLFFAIVCYFIVSAYLGDGLISQMIKYQEGLISIEARSNYREVININSFIELVYFGFISVIQYALEPFPWRWGVGWGDMVIAITNALEIILFLRVLIFVMKYSKTFRDGDRVLIRSFLDVYVLMLIVWGAGSANWGTAVRHHLVNFGLLLILYQVNSLYDRNKKIK